MYTLIVNIHSILDLSCLKCFAEAWYRLYIWPLDGSRSSFCIISLTHMSSQPSYLKLTFQGEMFTHNGCNDCCGSRRKQQLFEKAVPIIERFYQRPLMPGTLKTHKDKGADSNCFAVGGYTQIKPVTSIWVSLTGRPCRLSK